MADKGNDDAKQKMKEERDGRLKKQQALRDGMRGTPTPTQDECDMAVSGIAVSEHDDDGSGPDPHDAALLGKQSEAKPSAGGYATRAATPAPHKRAE